MKKRHFLFSIILLVLLTSCSKKDNSESPIEISYSIWDTFQEPGMQQIVDRFEEINPNIKVIVNVAPWTQYWQKLDAAGTAGNLPDVFWMHVNNFDRYQRAGLLADLTELFSSDEDGLDINNYYTGVSSLYTRENKLYAIPKDIDTIGLWYNKTMFDDAGIAYPDSTWTWETLLAMSQELTQPEKNIYGFFAFNDDQSGFDNFIYQNNGYVISEDQKKSGMGIPETIEAVEFYANILLKYNASPSDKAMSETQAHEALSTGQVAMALQGSWMLAYHEASEYSKENLDIAILPKGKTRATIANGLGNAVSAQSPNIDAAKKFAQFLGSQEANAIQASAGSAIPAFYGEDGAWVEQHSVFSVQNYVDQIPYGIPYPTSPSRNRWDPLLLEYLSPAWAGEVSVSDALKELSKEMNAILTEEE